MTTAANTPINLAPPPPQYFHHAGGKNALPSCINVEAWHMRPRSEGAHVLYQPWLDEFLEDFKRGPDEFNHDDFADAMTGACDAMRINSPGRWPPFILLDFEAWPATLHDPWIDPAFLQSRITRWGDFHTAERQYTIYARAALHLAMATVRRRYPNARVGHYSRLFFGWNQPPTDEVKRANDQQAWVFDEADFVSPKLYAPKREQCPNWWDRGIPMHAILEARRVAPHKPVIPCVSMNYCGRSGEGFLGPVDWNTLMWLTGSCQRIHWHDEKASPWDLAECYDQLHTAIASPDLGLVLPSSLTEGGVSTNGDSNGSSPAGISSSGSSEASGSGD